MQPMSGDDPIQRALAARVDACHLRLRLGIERDSEPRVFGQGRNFFHPENWYSMHSVIRNGLRLLGLHGRGRRNARAIGLVENSIWLPQLPTAFDGYRILQLTDLHMDMAEDISHAIIAAVRGVDYDICVLTGDYRASTFGPIDGTLTGLQSLRAQLPDPVYAVLGNHDSLRMVPAMEAMGIDVLLNERRQLQCRNQTIYLVGIDDPHYYRADNLEKAMQAVPHEAVSLLLSHSPELYRQAAHMGCDVMLSGHTHGGQICLPGGIPLTCNAHCPRAMCAGVWRFRGMQGYTSRGAGVSIVDVRLNCPPEITLHRLRRGDRRQ